MPDDQWPADMYSSVQPGVRHHYWDLRKIPEMVPDNCQAPFLGPSGTSFGIVRHQFWDSQAPVLGSHAYFFEFKTCFTLKTNIFQKKPIAPLNFMHKNTAFRN